MKQFSQHNLVVQKASGEREPFSLEKYKRSLRRAHVPEEDIEKIINDILPQLTSPLSTKALYAKTFEFLRRRAEPYAAHYSLKNALRLLGPSGFPFEKLVAHILQSEGYTTINNQTLPGKCITHEIDIIAHNKDHRFIVECKFHNRYGLVTDVRTVLYVKSRFNDVQTIQPTIKHCMVSTNTKFSSDAIRYAECEQIQLLAWGYPHDNSLEARIERHQLYPITVLPSLTTSERTKLLRTGIVLAQELSTDHDAAIAPARRALLQKEYNHLVALIQQKAA